MLKTGLYEQVIYKQLDKELSECEDKLSQTVHIDEGESSKVLSKYVAEIIEKGLDNLIDKGGNVQDQIGLVNQIVSTVISGTKDIKFDELSIAPRAEQLLSFLNKKDCILAVNEKAEIIRPETSIAQSSLFTGAINEPQMFTELKNRV